MLNNASEEIVEEFKTIYDKIQKRYEIENLIKETEGNLTEENLDKLSNLLDNANIENKYKLSYISKYDRFLNNYTNKLNIKLKFKMLQKQLKKLKIAKIKQMLIMLG